MAERRMPASLWWLALLVALSVLAAAAAIVVIRLETRATQRTRAEAITGGRIDAGRAAIARFGCGACHVVPAIHGATGVAGPDLTGVGKRTTIAGRLANDPAAMTRWLMHPQAIVPGNGMPEVGVDARAARDIAAYLYAES